MCIASSVYDSASSEQKVYLSMYDVLFVLKSDELSFDEGDLLYILDFSDSGWWKAKCGDVCGLIPSNYGEYGLIVHVVIFVSENQSESSSRFLKVDIISVIFPKI